MTIAARFPDVADWKAQVKCQAACPVETDAGRYVQLIAEGRDREAYRVARAPNPFASVCGRVCAAPCEDACRRGSIDEPIAIRGLKRFLTERYGVESVRPQTQEALFGTDGCAVEGNTTPLHLPARALSRASGRRVAVIGAGPAGLSAAHDLALLGYRVTVLEAAGEPGGMMRFGIPEYRLPRTLIKAEIDRILALGVELRLGTALSSSYGLAALKREGFDAVFLSVGVSKGRDLSAPGVELDGVVKAVDYLLNVNRGFRMDLGRRVVVIGGGFVAFDAARTALRIGREDDVRALGAKLGEESDARLKEALDSARAAIRGGAAEVTLVSLESFDEMPVLKTTQGHEEFEEAKKEGVAFLPRRGPKRFVGSSRLEAIELRRVVSVFDASGRFSPAYDDEDVVTIDADACVLAIGQKADLSFLTREDGVVLTPAGTIQVDKATLATSAPGVYAGGDVAFGPRNLIEAVANGKRAARSIHEWLQAEALATRAPGRDRRTEVPADPLGAGWALSGAAVTTTLDIEKLATRSYRRIAGFEVFDREAPPTLELGRRTGISEVETGYVEADARRQAARCLICHVQTIYDPEACILCGRCVDVCPEYCLALVPFEELDLTNDERAGLKERAEAEDGLPLSAMVKDEERCIRCGLCAIRCPTDAMTMERFTVTETYTPPDLRSGLLPLEAAAAEARA
jgi:formate dehydrogenase beta subunit